MAATISLTFVRRYAPGMRGAVSVLLLLGACTSNAPASDVDASTGAGVGGSCSGAGDCAASLLCAFPIADGCHAKGTCVQPDVTCMNDGPAVCACDGSIVGLACIYGAGNAPAPVVSKNPCSPSDASPGDASSE